MAFSRTKQFAKKQLLTVHQLSKLEAKLRSNQRSESFLCVITPTFDSALTSLKKLTIDLRHQTNKDFVHVVISNGPSPKTQKFVELLHKNDKRFIYVEQKHVKTSSFASIISNSGSRREYCLQHFNASRYVFLDADVHIVDTNYFSKLYFAHTVFKSDVLVTNVNYHGSILPIHPTNKEGNIVIGNYCFTKSIAKRYHYPTNYDKKHKQGNDYRYWRKISSKEKVTYLDFVATIEGEDRSYKRMTDKKIEEDTKGELISVFGNSFLPEDLSKMNEVLQSHLVGYGSVVNKFEIDFSYFIGFKYGVATNSCTNAFWVLLKALNLKSSDEVIVPSIHFFGIKNVLELLGIKYMVTDVDEIVPNMSLASLESCITKRTKVIIALDYGGYPLKIKKIKSYLRRIGRKDIILILDAANSPFTKLNNQYTACDYNYAIYSFDMNKILVTGDGGMIVSNNKKVMDECRSLSYYGIVEKNKTSFSKSAVDSQWWEVGETKPSLKLAMNNLTAALGLSQLDNINTNLAARKVMKELYYKKLKQLQKDGHIVLPPAENNVTNASYLLWLIIKDKKTRNELAYFLRRKNIYTTVKYEPLGSKKDAPVAWDFFERSLCIPLNPNITSAIVDYIVSQLIDFFYEK